MIGVFDVERKRLDKRSHFTIRAMSSKRNEFDRQSCFHSVVFPFIAVLPILASVINKIGTTVSNGMNVGFHSHSFCKYQHRKTDTYKYFNRTK